MQDEIVVKVHSYGTGRALSLVWFDPISGKKKAKSAKTTDWREAERLAGELQRELAAGRYAPPSKITWAEFRKRYEEEHLASLKPKTAKNTQYVLDAIEQHLNPDRLIKINSSALSTLQSKIRATGVKETTIACILRHVHAALGWAVSVGMLPAVPKMVMPKQAKGRKMKGGALVAEQFDRMLGAIEKVLFPPIKRTDKRAPKGILTPGQQQARRQTVEAWKRYLTGLWLSGLRLSESLALSWDYDAPFALDLSGRRPRFRIHGEAQKSGKDELLPLTPDAAEFFLTTPEEERVGPVFKLVNRQGQPYTVHEVGTIVAEIGKKAGVMVATEKTASAHDLRRSFGTRWAKRVAPAILQKLMRHASIQTTMAFYVDLDADEMADELWASHGPNAGNTKELGNKTGNKRPKAPKNETSPEVTSPCRASS
jgi:integrase